MADQIDFAKVVIWRLDENTPGISVFKNQKRVMVDHLQKDALNEQNRKMGTTWVWVYGGRVVLGYVTLTAYSINKKHFENDRNYAGTEQFPYGTIPALLIGQLATHEEYERQGVGKRMVAWATKMAIDLSKIVGCRMVAVHPYDDVAGWYEKQKFKKVSGNLTIMYLDIGGW
ncbi:MAG: GNAT family N-acetyltransferase [Proteobacteria bacterium]|nr:GNAT family N-acetyltransferase [Pseudomonadota bacterium]